LGFGIYHFIRFIKLAIWILKTVTGDFVNW
jgi:hypothetical protein